MRARIINKEHEYYNNTFKIHKMNYDYIVIYLEDNSEYSLKREDVEFISENEGEDIIVDCIDLIKIKLNNGIAFTFYKLLTSCIEEKIQKKIDNIIVLTDIYNINRRGIWEKKLFLVINNKIPLTVDVIGRKFDSIFNITINEVSQDDFIKICTADMKRIKEEIEEKENLLKIYQKTSKNIQKKTKVNKKRRKEIN